MLVECVSKGGNLLLNVGPNAKGEIPRESVERLEAVGRWMDANSESIHGAGPAAVAKPDWGRYTAKGQTVFAHLFEKPVGTIRLAGLRRQVKRARLVADGSEVNLSTPWMVGENAADAFINLGGAQLPDDLDTVVALQR
jgi:alpha-L-fucosidase